ncbi:hypothetical protein HNR32_000651 [Pectinatus brassicae]|uniref:Uncharacterized protein n=1 Tax=Pectinatus brassicae TaxID=862415 RepID=A0A840URR4_9FIRM|nr:hypothetical protein [Pectinatus brassicae]
MEKKTTRNTKKVLTLNSILDIIISALKEVASTKN